MTKSFQNPNYALKLDCLIMMMLMPIITS